MGVISINGLRLTAYHGVMEQERRVGNTFEVNVALDVPASDRAEASDCLDDTINYAQVVEIVKREMSVPSRLLEHVAGRIKNHIIADFGHMVAAGKVEVKKLAPPISGEMDSVSYLCQW